MEALKHHELKAEWVNDKHGPAVMLEQVDGWDNEQTVILHPHQLRAVCEQFGILAGDEQASKTIATLRRRMLALRDRLTKLEAYMVQFSDHKHADLSYELVNLSAIADLADEWCADFEQPDVSPVTPMSPVPVADVSQQSAPAANAEQATLL